MSVPRKYQADVEAILEQRHRNGGDLWATRDGRLGVGSPFSTVDCALMLWELGVNPSEPVLKSTAGLIIGSWREDGRFRTAPGGAIYPCHTARIARILCRLGYASDARLKGTFEHLLETQHSDGGWRCNTYKYGRGPETAFSNPGPTLEALDAFRFTPYLNRDRRLDKTVEFLLKHWTTRKPLGPCHFGIGSLFMKVEFPFFRYNLFFYVYTLSFYRRAMKDERFLEALRVLTSRVVDGKIVVENPHRKLAEFSFCEKGKPSDVATARYLEILRNIGKAPAERLASRAKPRSS